MVEIPKRNIFIPNEIKETLENLAMQRNETQGVLFYQAYADNGDLICPVFSFYKTGEGSPGKVSSDPQKIRTVREFLQLDYGQGIYAPIFWHCHTIDTIRLYGSDFASNFSQDDIIVADRNMVRDPLYTLMLTTPNSHLMHGKGELALSFVNDFQGYRENSSEIERELRRLEHGQ